MVKVYKVFKNNEDCFMVCNFDKGTVNLLSKGDLKAQYGDVNVIGTLIEKEVKNAWAKIKESALEVDGSLVLFMYVQGVDGTHHRIRFADKTYRDIEKHSFGVGASNGFFENPEFNWRLA